jgi:hypothetical protein
MGSPEIKVQLDITPEQINAAVVNAIVNSAVGKELHASIERAVKQLGTSNYWDTALDKMVKEHINDAIRDQVAKELRPEIVSRVAKAMTAERLAPLIEAAAELAVSKIDKSIADRQW